MANCDSGHVVERAQLQEKYCQDAEGPMGTLEDNLVGLCHTGSGEL